MRKAVSHGIVWDCGQPLIAEGLLKVKTEGLKRPSIFFMAGTLDSDAGISRNKIKHLIGFQPKPRAASQPSSLPSFVKTLAYSGPLRLGCLLMKAQ
jgi:hypothetical protein